MSNEKVFGIKKGDRVKLLGGHPHAGKVGTCTELKDTMLGVRPLIELDDSDQRCFVMKHDQAVVVITEATP